MKADSLLIRNNRVFVAHNRDDRRKALPNVSNRRDLLCDLHAIGQAAEPTHREVSQVRTLQQIDEIGGTEKVDDRGYLDIPDKALAPFLGRPGAFVVKARAGIEHPGDQSQMTAGRMTFDDQFARLEPAL